MTMITLHGQTGNANFADIALNTARSSVIPSLYSYTRGNESSIIFYRAYELSDGNDESNLRDREILKVDVYSQTPEGVYTTGLFDNRQALYEKAKVSLGLCEHNSN